jgi:hypothetical protein
MSKPKLKWSSKDDDPDFDAALKYLSLLASPLRRPSSGTFAARGLSSTPQGDLLRDATGAASGHRH